MCRRAFLNPRSTSLALRVGGASFLNSLRSRSRPLRTTSLNDSPLFLPICLSLRIIFSSNPTVNRTNCDLLQGFDDDTFRADCMSGASLVWFRGALVFDHRRVPLV